MAASYPAGDGGSDAENERPDTELVRLCQSGNLAAFDELVVRYRGKVYAMIVNMVKNEADAWDLAQDAFIKAWKALPKFEGRSAFYTWLYRIVHNVTYDWMRKKKIQASGEFDESFGMEIDPAAKTIPNRSARPDHRLENRELGAKIEAALEQLSPEHREVMLLKEVDGFAYQEIADSVGCSIGTVMSRLFYARKKMQALLGAEYSEQSSQ